ncbi:MAG: ABC transporter ATP-binding protein, partial [Gammaproteobacteria bacterium]|nr:ABC transporter ATP-binding protein [Gammaproteobacteria bacterium]
MLEVRKLSRSYDGFVAVDDVTFNIGKGEIVGLLGHNGAGKTTIMKMLSGYLEPDQGQITIDGTDLSVDPKKVQQCLGYLPENLPIYPEMSVADYLDYAADLKGLSNDLKRAEIKRVI